MNMAPHDEENSFSAMIPVAAAVPHTRNPRLEEFRDDNDRLCSSRKVRRTELGRCQDYYGYSTDELETADALILFSLSKGGFCISPSSVASDSTSGINSRVIESNATETLPTTISRDEKNPLLLRIKLGSKAKRGAYKCDTCDREFSSPQALGGHKTSHRDPKPATLIPDLNVPSRVFECSICGDVYDSGQALGGHKRKHRNLQSS